MSEYSQFTFDKITSLLQQIEKDTAAKFINIGYYNGEIASITFQHQHDGSLDSYNNVIDKTLNFLAIDKEQTISKVVFNYVELKVPKLNLELNFKKY